MRRIQVHEIEPEEIFLDSTNLPGLDSSQFEGRVERPLSRMALSSVGIVFVLAVLVFLGKMFSLQIVHGDDYASLSRENRLDRSVIFATRGVIYDRNSTPLAWNESAGTSTATTTYALRHYTERPGFSHVLGFVRYPRKDSSGLWWREEYAGVSGVEFSYDSTLRGVNGSELIEENALGEIRRAHIVDPPTTGGDVTLTISADVQEKLSRMLTDHARRNNFRGGAAVIMDVHTGELLALTSFPEYDNNAFARGDSHVIAATHNDARSPNLHRAIAGLYAPGSIVKPIFASAALNENIISPEKEIISTGELLLPNPYNPEKPSRFRDWKAHGYVDMRAALAVSSDIYFYVVGGGFGGQMGLGIEKIEEYARRFGLGDITGIFLGGEEEGVIPTPEWKARVFGDDPWRIGDTYITTIGQFGFQITPLQAVVYTAALANGGARVTPSVFGVAHTRTHTGISNEHLQIVREGMRAAVSSEHESRTARALDMTDLTIAAKTGTAELGERNQYMNSWVIGFWPYENPKYSFAVVLERAPAGTLSGAAPAMRPFFEWLVAEKPEYVNEVIGVRD